MSSSSLPFRTGIAVRDKWRADDSPVQRALPRVKELLGIDVEIEVSWESLLSDLNDAQNAIDSSVIVSSVASDVEQFLHALWEVVNIEVDPKWNDTLIEKAGRCLRLFIGVSKEDDPAVFWCSEKTGLDVCLSRNRSMLRAEALSSFKTKLLHCFIPQPTPSDTWVDLSTTIPNNGKDATEPRQSFDPMPDFKMLPKPDELLLKPPYHLVVYGGGNALVEIQCSHSPTLEMLANYLKKWCKVNYQHVHKPPAVDIELHPAMFSFGTVYDRLTLSVNERSGHYIRVSPMIVLSLVEGVLGYQSVSSSDTRWTFRRDVELKKP
ncbi:hypothetical protein GGR54DRAFT_589480 [Hypoxylon sp. NC1633]|nr:hypothetical protein GGR54DRAFT_589480 [Hypoxylon sp. NC1633]